MNLTFIQKIQKYNLHVQPPVSDDSGKALAQWVVRPCLSNGAYGKRFEHEKLTKAIDGCCKENGFD